MLKKSVYKQLTTRPPTDQEIVWYQVRSALHENTYTYAIYCTAFKCGASQSIRKLKKNVLEMPSNSALLLLLLRFLYLVTVCCGWIYIGSRCHRNSCSTLQAKVHGAQSKAAKTITKTIATIDCYAMPWRSYAKLSLTPYPSIPLSVFLWNML